MLDERLVHGHVLRGDSLLGLRRWTEAFAAFTDAAKLDPHQFDASSWATRGDGFLEGGQPELALQASAQSRGTPETQEAGTARVSC